MVVVGVSVVTIIPFAVKLLGFNGLEPGVGVVFVLLLHVHFAINWIIYGLMNPSLNVVSL
jgi:hypothetical protein